MSNKVKDIDIKRRTYCFFDGIINVKNFDPNNIEKKLKVMQKYSYLLHWIFDDQRLEIR